jgi:hypothetical protein
MVLRPLKRVVEEELAQLQSDLPPDIVDE